MTLTKTEYMRQWRAKNPGYEKKWRLDNPDKVKASNKKFSSYQKAWRKANPEKIAAKNRKYQKNNPLIGSDYRKSHRQQHRAWSAVWNALLSGKMQRPSICARCRENCKPQAHHKDYSKPLDVMWLCRKCHRERHLCTPISIFLP